MTADEKIKKANMGLILNKPFYASLLFSLEFKEDSNCESCETNGKTLWYNPDFVSGLTTDELQGVLAHETLHVAYCHHTRRGKRDHTKWNVATDYAINALLLDDKFVLPKDRLYEPGFKDKSAEEIYSLLPDEDSQKSDEDNQESERDNQKGDDQESDADNQKSDENQKKDPGGCGGVVDAPTTDDKELEDLEFNAQQAVIQAAFIAQAQSKCPEYIKRILDDILKPRINWKEALSQFLSTISRNDYSWLFPNTRYLHTGLYLPSLRSEEPGRVILIIDTSGSIDDELIKQFSGEVQEILNIFKISLTIIYCDDLVRSVQYLEPDDEIKLEPNGGNGTDFIPGFEYIEENDLQPKAVVYLTDGYCKSFPENPEYPVLWAIYGYCNFKPPFGEIINVID